MSGGGGGGDTTTTQEPWEGARPHLLDIMARGAAQSGQPLSLASMGLGQRRRAFQDIFGMNPAQASRATGLPLAEMIRSGGIVPFTGAERGAMDKAEFEAAQHRPSGINLTMQTARGNFLSPDTNPFLRETYTAASEPLLESFQERILPALRSQFTMAGHGASGAPEQFEAETASRGLTRSLADLSAGIYGPAYQLERQLMEAAQSRLPMMGLQDQTEALRRIGALQGVGAAERGMAQQYGGLIGQVQGEPWQQLQNYMQTVQPSTAFVSTSQPYYQNQLLGGLGGAATGAGLGAMFGGPLAAGLGGLAGLGAGLFF